MAQRQKEKSEKQAHAWRSELVARQNLFNAVIAGIDGPNRILIRDAVRDGADVNAPQLDTGETSLHLAAKYGKNRTCLALIFSGANINVKDNLDRTPLHHAADEGHMEICKLLINRYAKSKGNVKEFISAKDIRGFTALHHAAAIGNKQICLLLIREYAKAGGDIRLFINAESNDSGHEAAYYASANGRLRTAQMLTSLRLLEPTIGKELIYPFLKSFAECLAA